MLDCLKRTDHTPELLPSFGILNRSIQYPLHSPDHFGAQSDGGKLHCAGQRAERVAIRTQECGGRDTHVVKLDFIKLASGIHRRHWFEMHTVSLSSNRQE